MELTIGITCYLVSLILGTMFVYKLVNSGRGSGLAEVALMGLSAIGVGAVLLIFFLVTGFSVIGSELLKLFN